MNWRTIIGIVVFGAWVALSQYNQNIAMLALGVPMTLFGLVGIARRRITAKGRFGPQRTYTGIKAILVGVFFVAIAGFLSIDAAQRLWPALFQGVAP